MQKLIFLHTFIFLIAYLTFDQSFKKTERKAFQEGERDCAKAKEVIKHAKTFR